MIVFIGKRNTTGSSLNLKFFLGIPKNDEIEIKKSEKNINEEKIKDKNKTKKKSDTDIVENLDYIKSSLKLGQKIKKIDKDIFNGNSESQNYKSAINLNKEYIKDW